MRPALPISFALLSGLAEAAGLDVLRYTVRADPFEVVLTLPDGTRKTAQPKRGRTHFYFHAEKGWPVPAGLESKRVRCEIRWNGFDRDWRLVNSFGVDRRTQQFVTTLGELRKAVFAGGDFRLFPARNGILLVTRAEWKFPLPEVARLLETIAGVQSAVWQDRRLRGHVVYLLALEESGPLWQGEARTHTTVLEASLNAAKPADLALGFAHELFHEWNPRRLNPPEDERLYWFTEGVTEYYAAITLWRAGLWTFDRLLDSFNTTARLYYGSSARNLTADRMVEQRKSNSWAERLPYLQGALLAAHWNLDGSVLDRSMRYLRKSSGEPLSNRRIAAALEAAGVKNAREEIERFVMRGETIALRRGIWGDCAVERRVEVRSFDMGFDLEESKRTGTITAVRQPSNAWDAGVRDGQQWTPIDVVWGDPGYLIELEVRDRQGVRRVKYHPAASRGEPVPQYTATPSDQCAIPLRRYR